MDSIRVIITPKVDMTLNTWYYSRDIRGIIFLTPTKLASRLSSTHRWISLVMVLHLSPSTKLGGILRDELLVTIMTHTQHTNALLKPFHLHLITAIAAKNTPSTPKLIDVPRVIWSLLERPEPAVRIRSLNEFCMRLSRTAVGRVGHSYITTIRNNVLGNVDKTIWSRKCDIVVILGRFAHRLVFVRMADLARQTECDIRSVGVETRKAVIHPTQFRICVRIIVCDRQGLVEVGFEDGLEWKVEGVAAAAKRRTGLGPCRVIAYLSWCIFSHTVIIPAPAGILCGKRRATE